MDWSGGKGSDRTGWEWTGLDRNGGTGKDRTGMAFQKRLAPSAVQDSDQAWKQAPLSKKIDEGETMPAESIETTEDAAM